jgi:hypothetical protein
MKEDDTLTYGTMIEKKDRPFILCCKVDVVSQTPSTFRTDRGGEVGQQPGSVE